MLTVAIPTYHRGRVLCDTLELLLALEVPPREIVVVDQTPAHPPDVEERLRVLGGNGIVRIVRLEEPSIPRAMNRALEAATSSAVLFLDDDIIPAPRLVAAHAEALRAEGVWAVVGQVLQPGEEPAHFEEAVLRRGAVPDLEFRFNHDASCAVENVMAGNLSVWREKALSVGGFDERYVAVAYRFETDFARRILAAGGRIRYEPAASIHHLKAPGGGVRAYGDHRTSASFAHSHGDYYFARKHVPRFWPYVARRLRANVLNRYLLSHPWYIPMKLTGELRGLLRALRT
jgi:GT2 family glycosyltransferase